MFCERQATMSAKEGSASPVSFEVFPVTAVQCSLKEGPPTPFGASPLFIPTHR